MKKIFLIALICLLPNLVWSKNIESQVVAAVIIGEAGGEGEVGMLAVAGVIKNRMGQSRSAYEVVTRPFQFAAYSNPVLKKEMPIEDFVAKAALHSRWPYAMLLAEKISESSIVDITEGATHFHTASTSPYWSKIFQFKVQIGNHKFYCKWQKAN